MNSISLTTQRSSQGQHYVKAQLEYSPADHTYIRVEMNIPRIPDNDTLAQVQAQLWTNTIEELKKLVALLQSGKGAQAPS